MCKIEKETENFIIDILEDSIKENSNIHLKNLKIREPDSMLERQNMQETYKLYSLLENKYGIKSKNRDFNSNIFIVENPILASAINDILTNADLVAEIKKNFTVNDLTAFAWANKKNTVKYEPSDYIKNDGLLDMAKEWGKLVKRVNYKKKGNNGRIPMKY